MTDMLLQGFSLYCTSMLLFDDSQTRWILKYLILGSFWENSIYIFCISPLLLALAIESLVFRLGVFDRCIQTEENEILDTRFHYHDVASSTKYGQNKRSLESYPCLLVDSAPWNVMCKHKNMADRLWAL